MSGLVVRDVSVRFGGLAALQDVSFEVAPRTVVGVIGPNGAGKTTLFNVISGFVRPTSGDMTWEGKAFRPSPVGLIGAGIARTLQGVGLFPRLTALENVMVGGAGRRRSGFAGALFALPGTGRDEQRLRDAAMAWLERLEVADVAAVVASTLPYPVQKRVALARALVGEPRLLLLDEPAGGLGADDLAQLAELIRSLPAEERSPCAVVLVEHHMDLVMSVCDQVVVLDFGKMVRHRHSGAGAGRSCGGHRLSRRRRAADAGRRCAGPLGRQCSRASTGMTALLEVSGLTAGYNKAAVLHDVELSLEPASITAVLGANGAGKTTLLRTLSGLLRPTSGSDPLPGRSAWPPPGWNSWSRWVSPTYPRAAG